MFSVFDLLVLAQIPNIGAQRLRILVSHFGTPTEVRHATAREIAMAEGFSKKLASSVVHFFRTNAVEDAQRYAERQLSRLNAAQGNILTYWDKRYPDILKKIYDPPPYIFMTGDIADADRFALAIVGTRSPSEYGVRITEQFCREITKLGMTIVSGLARGIDTVAHSTAIKFGGRTIAVIGSGIDVVYPPENKSLSERLSFHGAMLSEYAMGAKPDAVNFPRRNRLISGLTLGTLVVETDIGGGAMITANTALDQNREVFAVPGPIFSKRSKGCHTLIKEGKAKLVENIDDVVCELSIALRPILGSPSRQQQSAPPMTLFEKNIYDTLSDHPCHIDVLAERLRQATSDTLVNLLSLEFKGLVKQLPGKMFVRI